MEYWNAGILDLSELDFFHMDGTDQKIIRLQWTVFDPQYSIVPVLLLRISDIPLFHGFSDDQDHPSGVKSNPAAGGAYGLGFLLEPLRFLHKTKLAKGMIKCDSKKKQWVS